MGGAWRRREGGKGVGEKHHNEKARNVQQRRKLLKQPQGAHKGPKERNHGILHINHNASS